MATFPPTPQVARGKQRAPPCSTLAYGRAVSPYVGVSPSSVPRLALRWHTAAHGGPRRHSWHVFLVDIHGGKKLPRNFLQARRAWAIGRRGAGRCCTCYTRTCLLPDDLQGHGVLFELVGGQADTPVVVMCLSRQRLACTLMPILIYVFGLFCALVFSRYARASGCDESGRHIPA